MMELWVVLSQKNTYRSAIFRYLLDEGFSFNLQTWAREYLENNQYLLEYYVGQPMTPHQKWLATYNKRF